MAKIDRILRAAEATPWAMQPQKLWVIAEILAARAAAGEFPTQAEAQEMEARQSGRVATAGSVAVLPVFGTISRRMGMMEAMSGGVSVEGLSKNFAELVNDDSVSAIVLDVDSPGGSVYGIEELNNQIFDARKHKRVIAVADQLMASAAYYIASAADEVVISPSGEVGSIGVFTMHFDFSAHLEDEGVAVTIIKAGERKAEGNPYEPLDEEAVAHIQENVDAYYKQFVGAVARNMGVSRATVEADFGQGLTFTAKAALDRGMVHRIATLDEVLVDLTGGAATKKTNRSAAEEIRPAIAAMREHLAVAASSGEAVPTRAMASKEIAETISGAIHLFRQSDAVEPEEKSKTDAAAGHVAEVPDQDAPTEPASQARENSMSADEGKVAPTDGATDEQLQAAIEADRQRGQSIRAICSEHGVDVQKADAWVNEGRTVQEVNENVLKVIAARDSAGAAVDVQIGDTREHDAPFSNFGDQLMAVVAAEAQGAVPDPRLMGLNKRAAATGSGGAVPSDGGFLVQPEFTGEILRRVYDLGEVVTRVRRRPIGPNADGLIINAVSESSRATGSRYGGIQVYWADEGATVTAKKPKFRQMELYLRKLMGIWYVTDELLKDAVALEAIGVDAFSEEIAFVVEDSVFRGTGAGQPLGFLNSAAKVEVAKESAQVAATINATNVLKMFGRMWPRSRKNAVWFINVDAEHQLPLMTIANQPVYLPPGGLSNSPFGTLLGRPVIPVEYCETLGTAGDIILADLDQYLMIDKGRAEQAWSIHVRFINDEQTFRITYRVDGQPTWKTALTPYKGTATQSPFITLAVRS